MPESSLTALFEDAAKGSESAWREIVRRYSPLVYSVCRNNGVLGADADDVSGNVWLGLVTYLIRIRVPEALPGWMVRVTTRECMRLVKERRRQIADGREIEPGTEPGTDVPVLARERMKVVLGAFALLPQRDRDLLTMLFSDPPASYSQISSSLGIPVGAIGPTRQRCLARARRIPSIAALLTDDDHPALPSPRMPLQGLRRAG